MADFKEHRLQKNYKIIKISSKSRLQKYEMKSIFVKQPQNKGTEINVIVCDK